MAISHIATSVPTGNPTTSFTMVIDSGTLANDVLLVTAIHKGTADPTVTDDDSGGNLWAKILEIDDGTRGYSLWWKRATSGTASKTVTVGSLTN
jgi:hypothetical protein